MYLKSTLDQIPPHPPLSAPPSPQKEGGKSFPPLSCRSRLLSHVGAAVKLMQMSFVALFSVVCFFFPPPCKGLQSACEPSGEPSRAELQSRRRCSGRGANMQMQGGKHLAHLEMSLT